MKNMDSMNKMGLPSYSIPEVVEIYMIIFLYIFFVIEYFFFRINNNNRIIYEWY